MDARRRFCVKRRFLSFVALVLAALMLLTPVAGAAVVLEIGSSGDNVKKV